MSHGESEFYLRILSYVDFFPGSEDTKNTKEMKSTKK